MYRSATEILLTCCLIALAGMLAPFASSIALNASKASGALIAEHSALALKAALIEAKRTSSVVYVQLPYKVGVRALGTSLTVSYAGSTYSVDVGFTVTGEGYSNAFACTPQGAVEPL